MRLYISDYLSKSFSETNAHRLSEVQNRDWTSFICSLQVEADSLVSPDLQVHLDFQEPQEPQEPSQALSMTSPLVSLHIYNVSLCFSPEMTLINDSWRHVYGWRGIVADRLPPITEFSFFRFWLRLQHWSSGSSRTTWSTWTRLWVPDGQRSHYDASE